MAEGNKGQCKNESAAVGLNLTARAGIAVYINSARMGVGDERLGEILMAAYVESLNHHAKQLSSILLTNSAVTLACKGSPVLDSLQGLHGMGIKVLACGTCLWHLGLTESLAVGEVSNMVAIVGAMTAASKVMSP